MGPGSPPSDSPSTVERGPRSGCMSARAALCPLSLLQCAGCGPDPSPLGPWSPFSHWPLHCLLHVGFGDPPPASHALHRVPARSGLGRRTARKSRWSLLYCHRLARRLDAAREDFSLSGLRVEGSQEGTHSQEAGWAGKTPGQAPECLGQPLPVPLLLDEDELSEPIKVQQVSGGNGAGHHQVVEHSYDVDQHLGWGRFLTHAARQLLDQVAHHLRGCGRPGVSLHPYSRPPGHLGSPASLRELD